MEISGKVLREVEFRDRLRGYDTDEVDEFLEKVAVAVDEMQAELVRLRGRPEAQPRPVEELAGLDDDAIRRTLVLAQRTADLAVSEARDEAERVVAEARQQSETLLTQAQESVRRLRTDAEQEVHDRVRRLEAERDRLEHEAAALAALLEGERQRLAQGLGAALRFVEESLAVSPELGRVAERTPAPTQAVDVVPAPAPAPAPAAAPPVDAPTEDARGFPDVEAEISEDAATAVRRDDPPPTVYGLADTSPPPALDADEALWAQWAAGGSREADPGYGASNVREMPLGLDRRSGGGRSA